MRASILLAAGLLSGLAGIAAPATAQTRGTVITIFGNDKCPVSNGEQTNICVRAPESERFRIPETLRETNNAAPAAQRRVDAARAVDNSTIGTCSASGPGGMIGCQRQEFAKARAERKAAKAAVPVIE
ncbi:hypothetical protein [Sphingomonas prati]|uniref:DUF4124 domain-containing protein n=1 Tax=Sphingomonas prati TaxID=1843237 RepID=A0A7W9BTY7_9SPHN|nr:hypothetical protein [Sphingomonas prati]MBB5729955.1 hypothetical protein [Sphingomonas prati]GGE88222.1 hypothetical protein GCM10011404_21300 [Sphingomonas prati]